MDAVVRMSPEKAKSQRVVTCMHRNCVHWVTPIQHCKSTVDLQGTTDMANEATFSLKL